MIHEENFPLRTYIIAYHCPVSEKELILSLACFGLWQYLCFVVLLCLHKLIFNICIFTQTISFPFIPVEILPYSKAPPRYPTVYEVYFYPPYGELVLVSLISYFIKPALFNFKAQFI